MSDQIVHPTLQAHTDNMKAQGGWGRNWDELMRNYSSGDDSDEHDTPNIVSFQKNCKRNAELIQSFVPHMTPEGANVIPPMLMQDPYVMHGDLLKSGFFDSDRSGVFQEGFESTAQDPERVLPSNDESQPKVSVAPEKPDFVEVQTEDGVVSEWIPVPPPPSPLVDHLESEPEPPQVERAECCPPLPVEAEVDAPQRSDGVLV
jgi:hypothetical protein